MSDAQQGAWGPATGDSRQFRRGPVWAAAMALALVGALALGGCTPAEPTAPTSPSESTSAAVSPSPTPSTSETPSPAPSPSSTEPGYPESLLVQPEEMKKDDEVGAVAAAKYYMGLVEYANLTGDVAMWSEMALPGCEFCEITVTKVREVHDTGGWTESGSMDWRGEPEVSYVEGVNVWELTLRAKVAEGRTFDSDGEVTRTYEKSRVKVRIGVTFMHQEWRIQGIRVSGDN